MAGYVPTTNLTVLYANTEPGIVASPAAVDNAIVDIVDTINSNYDNTQNLNADVNDKITVNKNNIDNHIASSTAHSSDHITYSGPISGVTNLKAAVEKVNTSLNNHVDSSTAHNGQNIVYSGGVAGSSNVTQAIDSLKTQLDQATISGDSGPEAASARFNSYSGDTYPTLKTRLDAEYEQNVDTFAEITIEVKLIVPEVKYTAAIQRAIDKAKTINATRIVLPQNVLMTVDQINVDGLKNCVISGGNIQLNFINGVNIAAFYVTNANNVTFDNVRILGCSDSTSTFNGAFPHDALYVTTSSFVKVINCTFEKFTSQAIYARMLNGGTYTEGIRVQGCIFRDFSYDSTATNQYAVFLDDDAEYSYVSYCQFYRVPYAIKCRNGANSSIDHNIIMQCNNTVSTLDATRGLIYCEHFNNGSKINIEDNKINHNASANIPIVCKGDPAHLERAFRIINNDILINGNGVVDIGIYLLNAYNSRVSGNVINPTLGSSNGCIRLDSSDYVIVTENLIYGGNIAIYINNSIAVIGNNNYKSQTTGKVVTAGTGMALTASNIYNFVIETTGAALATDNASWTTSRTGAGVYKITHNMGNLNYAITVSPENALLYSAVRANNDVTISFQTAAGVATDTRFSAQIKLMPLNTLYV